MLNSKMKRSMAWIMTAAVVMSAAPVSAADFSSEEVTAEAAESEDSVVSEENTDAVDESAEEDFASVDMAEDDADSADVAVEEESTDDAGDAFVSDGSEAENAETEDVVDDGTMTAEEFAAAAASADIEDVSAPYSSVEKGALEDKTYSNVTANVFVAGRDNTILGVNAYMTNPANPVGLGGVFGFPTTPMYNNAELTIEDGVPAVTVDIKNPIFQLLEIGNSDNAVVKETTYDTQDSGNYGKRITKLKIELKDYSGFYEFKNSVEFGTPLDDGNPDTDDRWHASVYLAIDFEELLPGSTIGNKVWHDDELHIGMEARGASLDGAELVVNEVTEGDVYKEYYDAVDSRMNRNIRGGDKLKPDFKLYRVSLQKDGKEFIPEGRFSANLLTGRKHYYYTATGGSGIQVWQIRNGELVRLSSQVTDGTEDMESEWYAQTQYSNFELGYVMVCTYENYIKCQKTFNDNLTGISLTWNSDEATQDNVPFPLNQERLNVSRLLTKEYNTDEINDSSIITKIKESNPDVNIYVDKAYGVWLEALINGQRTMAQYERYDTKIDVTLPVENASNKDDYSVYLVKISNGECALIKEMTVSEKDDSNVEFTLFNWTDRPAKTGITDELLYAGATNPNADEYEYLAVVRKIKQIEKPSVTTDLTYTGETLTGVNEGEGYTLEGNTAKLPGSYTAKATLKKGYAWKDGTTDPIEFTWNIKALQTAKPAAVTGLTYNGQNQTGVKSGTGYNLAGTYTAKNVGSYKAKVLLAEGYEWSDGTTDPLTLTWSISKADQTVNTKVATKSYKFTSLKKKAASFTIGASGQGRVTYKVVKTPAKASKYITVDKNGKVTLKKGAKVGTYTISVIAAGNENYNAGSKDVTIKVNKLTQKITAKVSKKTVKASSVKKKAATFNIGAKAKTTVSYKVVKTPDKAKKYISVNKKGKVTIKKKAPKGTYEIRVTAKANGTYNTATRTIKVVVK